MIAWQPAVAGGRLEAGLPPLGVEPPVTAGQLLREVPVLLVGAVVIAFVVKTFLAQLFYIPSASMVPQLNVGDRVAVSKLAYDLHPVRRGDVVVFHAPVQPKPDHAPAIWRAVRSFFQAVGLAQPSTEEFIKRVVALPGETVEGRTNGHIYVNGHVLIEPYLPANVMEGLPFAPVTVPKGRVWVMGDNRSDSQDSRFFGAISQSRIVGRAIWRVWPLNRLSFL